MGRKKKNDYKRTVFAKRIEELQLLRGYSSEYVLEHLLGDSGMPLINDRQVLDSYKSGKRKPRDFDEALEAFAKFYGVTADYLLGLEDTPSHQVKAVQEVTGLSEDAVRRLMQFKAGYPHIMAMVDAIIAGVAEDDIAYYLNLYRQIYEDYMDIKLGVMDSAYDMMKMQQRFFRTQSLYNYWQSIVIAKLASQFDNEMLMEADRREYEQSQEYQEYLDSIDFDM